MVPSPQSSIGSLDCLFSILCICYCLGRLDALRFLGHDVQRTCALEFGKLAGVFDKWCNQISRTRGSKVRIDILTGGIVS
jgi:hypothetical protein